MTEPNFTEILLADLRSGQPAIRPSCVTSRLPWSAGSCGAPTR